jgi:capsule polysaccharide export protein KpsE/RkpR
MKPEVAAAEIERLEAVVEDRNEAIEALQSAIESLNKQLAEAYKALRYADRVVKGDDGTQAEFQQMLAQIALAQQEDPDALG